NVVASLFCHGIPGRVSPVPVLGSDHARRLADPSVDDEWLVPDAASVPRAILCGRDRSGTVASRRQQLPPDVSEDNLCIFARPYRGHADRAGDRPGPDCAPAAALDLHLVRVSILRTARQSWGRGFAAGVVLRLRAALSCEQALSAQPVGLSPFPRA